MKTLTKGLLATSLCLLITLPVQAHQGREDLRDRFERQEMRIEQGIDSGRLTRREARELKHEQREIRELAHAYRDDGHLSRREVRKLDKKLDRLSMQIWDLTHNRKSRYGASCQKTRYDWRVDDRQPGHSHGW